MTTQKQRPTSEIAEEVIRKAWATFTEVRDGFDAALIECLKTALDAERAQRPAESPPVDTTASPFDPISMAVGCIKEVLAELPTAGSHEPVQGESLTRLRYLEDQKRQTDLYIEDLHAQLHRQPTASSRDVVVSEEEIRDFANRDPENDSHTQHWAYVRGFRAAMQMRAASAWPREDEFAAWFKKEIGLEYLKWSPVHKAYCWLRTRMGHKEGT